MRNRKWVLAGLVVVLVAPAALYTASRIAAPHTVLAVAADAPTSTSTSTPRPTPTPFAAHLAVDCDVAVSGVQATCDYVVGAQSIDIDILFVSDLPVATDVGSFGFSLRASDRTRLNPVPSVDLNANANPDANDLLGDHGVYCAPAPQADTHEAPPPAAVSQIGCTVGYPSHIIAEHSITQIARIHYIVPEGALPGSIDLTFLSGAFFGTARTDIGYCPFPGWGDLDPCTNGRINLVAPPPGSTPTPTWTATAVVPTPTITPTPTSSVIDSTTRPRPDAKNYFVLDCDTSSPGVQQACHYPIGVAGVDVAVLWGSNIGFPQGLAAFGFQVAGVTNGALIPKPGVDANWNANPDFNETGIPGIFQCDPEPRSREDPSGSGRYVSAIGCHTGRPAAAWLQDGEDAVLATVHYNATGTAAVVDLRVLVGSLYNVEFSELGSCYEVIGVEMPCLGTTIVIGNPPATVTPTASATPTATRTATNTPVATATNTPVPPTSTPTAATTPAPNTPRPAGTSVPAAPTVGAATSTSTVTSTPAPLTATALRVARCVERTHGKSWRSVARSAACIRSHPGKP